MADKKVVTLNRDNFEQEVLKSNIPVLVDFWANGCPPCLTIAPVIDEIASHFYKTIKVAKVNVDEEREIASKYKIMSIPSLILFERGNFVDKMTGFASKEELIKFIHENTGK